jgi:hypothetical protein
MSEEAQRNLEREELVEKIDMQNAELGAQDERIEDLQVVNHGLQEELGTAEQKVQDLEQANERLQEQLRRREIVAYSKLTRRQQKQWPKWVEEVDLSGELKLKKTFAFPKVGLQAMDRGKWVRLTGTAQPEGLTKEEGADICEYLNSFPENQTHLRNMDAEFRDDEEEAKIRAEMKRGFK